MECQGESVNVSLLYKDVIEWMLPLCRFTKLEDCVIADYKDNRLLLKFFTKDHEYHIVARLPQEYIVLEVIKDIDGRIIGESNHPVDNGYLSCSITTRKPRAGESWNRGRDMIDGPYRKETFDAIVKDILAVEMVKVVRKSENGVLDKK